MIYQFNKDVIFFHNVSAIQRRVLFDIELLEVCQPSNVGLVSNPKYNS